MANKIRELTIEIRDDSAISELESLFIEMRIKGLLSSNKLYSAIDGERANIVKKTGTYRSPKNKGRVAHQGNYDWIFAFTEDELKRSIGLDEVNQITTYLDTYNSPAIVVWDISQFEPITNFPEVQSAYKFKNPSQKLDAIIAIVNVSLPHYGD